MSEIHGRKVMKFKSGGGATFLIKFNKLFSRGVWGYAIQKYFFVFSCSVTA